MRNLDASITICGSVGMPLGRVWISSLGGMPHSGQLLHTIERFLYFTRAVLVSRDGRVLRRDPARGQFEAGGSGRAYCTGQPGWNSCASVAFRQNSCAPRTWRSMAARRPRSEYGFCGVHGEIGVHLDLAVLDVVHQLSPHHW